MAISNKTLDTHISELPKEISPERDLWQGIDKAITHDEQLTHKINTKAPVAWAASIVAAVLLTWYGTGVHLSNDAIDSNAKMNLVARMHHDFEQEKQLVLASFGQPKVEELSPAMQEQLKQLAQARNSIEKALKNDENNTDLINLLRWTQQQELKLIEKLYSPQWQTI